jgi:mRNA interferase MazF
VPLTRAVRTSSVEVLIDPDDDNRPVTRSSAQCQHVRSVATTRIHERTGNVGPAVLNEVRETLALLLDL